MCFPVNSGAMVVLTSRARYPICVQRWRLDKQEEHGSHGDAKMSGAARWQGRPSSGLEGRHTLPGVFNNEMVPPTLRSKTAPALHAAYLLLEGGQDWGDIYRVT